MPLRRLRMRVLCEVAVTLRDQLEALARSWAEMAKINRKLHGPCPLCSCEFAKAQEQHAGEVRAILERTREDPP